MRTHFRAGRAVILNVRNGRHWVLMTGITATGFTVRDPGYSVTTYNNADVVDSGIFNRPSGCPAQLKSEFIPESELPPLEPTPLYDTPDNDIMNFDFRELLEQDEAFLQ